MTGEAPSQKNPSLARGEHARSTFKSLGDSVNQHEARDGVLLALGQRDQSRVVPLVKAKRGWIVGAAGSDWHCCRRKPC